MKKMRNGIFKQILKAIPEEDEKRIKELASVLIDGGLTKDEVVEEIVDIIDSLIDFNFIFSDRPLIGSALEQIDGIVFRFIAKAIIKNI
tara:strand:- start:1315 stop:1581 length:267 start_codon:yes stop_codon:yes gene_type:complete